MADRRQDAEKLRGISVGWTEELEEPVVRAGTCAAWEASEGV